MKPTRITGRTALVTGSSTGIGAALADQLARNGNNLVLVARTTRALGNLAKKLEKQHGIKVKVLPMDLCDQEAVAMVHAETHNLGLHIDILVNNAGFNECGPFLSTDLVNELRIIQAQAAATVMLCKAFAPAMVQRGWGRIMNVGSTGSFAPCPLDAVYGATKAFIKSFSEALGAELTGSGVTVTALCPGATRTAFAAKAGVADSFLFNYGTMSPERVAQIGYQGMRKGKRVVIPGLHNRLMILSLKFSPRCVNDWAGKFIWRKTMSRKALD